MRSTRAVEAAEESEAAAEAAAAAAGAGAGAAAAACLRPSPGAVRREATDRSEDGLAAEAAVEAGAVTSSPPSRAVEAPLACVAAATVTAAATAAQRRRCPLRMSERPFSGPWTLSSRDRRGRR